MSVIQRFHEGGVFMYFILALGVVTFGFIVERFTTLFFTTKATPKDLRDKILDYIRRNEIKEAAEYTKNSHGNTSLGRVAAVGLSLRANGGGEEEIQSRMDEQLASEVSQLDKRTGFLAMFSNVATLLGLLGTISGMIQSFAAVASANPADRATLLSRGISEAMNCTAFGLIVAIPALIAYAVLQNRTEKMVTALTEETTKIYHDLLFLGTNPFTARRTTTEVTAGTWVPTPTPA